MKVVVSLAIEPSECASVGSHEREMANPSPSARAIYLVPVLSYSSHWPPGQ